MQPDSPCTPTLVPSLSRQVFWQRHINEWRDSGLSKKAYATQNSLVYQQLVYWCSKDEKKADDKAQVSDNFVAVSMAPVHHEPRLSIRLPNGITITDIDQHSIAWVGKLVEQL